MKKLSLLFFLLFIAGFALTGETWSDIAVEIGALLDQTVDLYSEGNSKEAKQKRNDAYYRVYNPKNVGATIQETLGDERFNEVENLFVDINIFINEEKAVEEIASIRDALNGALAAAASELDAANPRAAAAAAPAAETTTEQAQPTAAAVSSGLGESWDDLVNEIGGYLDKAVELYAAGNGEDAKQQRYNAYFRVYELKEMEQAVQRWIGGKHNFVIESMFAEITTIVNEGRPPQELAARRDELMAVLRETAAELNHVYPRVDIAPFTVFLEAFIILLREGMEALLILGAIAAILIKRGRRDQVKTVYLAAVAALAASAVLAVILNLVVAQVGAIAGGMAREIFEGFIMLTAVFVLLWVGGWLAKTASGGLEALKARVDDSSRGERIWVLASLSFLVVFREGAETVLFYQAIFNNLTPDRYGIVGLGMLAATALLVVGFFVVRFGSVKLPLKLFFRITGIFIFYMAFSIAGQAILEFHAAGWFLNTNVAFPAIPLLGIYPLWPGLLLQGIVLVVAILTYVSSFKTKKISPVNGEN